MKTKPISVSEVEYIACDIARKFMEWGEPIPEFGSRFPNVLESCLSQPFSTFDNKNLYKGLIGKGAILFYLMIKNHPFENGNKRIAVTTLLYFFFKHKKWLKFTNKNLYLFAKEVAESRPEDKDEIILGVQKFLKAYVVPFKESEKK